MDSSDKLHPAGAKILLCTTHSGSKISPSLFVKFLNGNGLLFNDYLCGKKENFQFYLPVLKSISLREIIAFLQSFVSVRYLTFKILFWFALFFHFPLRIIRFFLGGGGRGLQSNHDISINVFVRNKPIFVCRICELINT